jgi:hypothetical protein
MWKNGCIVTLKNDTIYGQIHHLDYQSLGQSCTFRVNPGSQETTYLPIDINGYLITNMSKYVSGIIDDNQDVFLEYLINGKLDLLYLRKNNLDRYFIQTDSLPLREITNEEEIRTINGVNYYYKSTRYVGLLTKYTEDAPQLYNRILHLKNDFYNLKKLTIDYHNLTCKDYECITYRSPESYTKIAVGPHFGMIDQVVEIGKAKILSNYLFVGTYFRVSSPRISKNLHFKTGVLVTNIKSTNYSSNLITRRKTIFNIPISVEYVIPVIQYKLKPKFSVGFNHFTNSVTYFTASIGADYNLNENTRLSILYERNLIGFGVKTDDGLTQAAYLIGAYFPLLN